MKPVILKIGFALAFSLGGMLYTFLRNKAIKPSRSPHDPSKSSGSNNKVNSSGRESPASKRDNFVPHMTPNSSQFDPLGTDKHDLSPSSNGKREMGDLTFEDLSPSSKSNADKDAYLLPEFNDLMREFDMAAMKTNPRVIKDIDEQELKRLRNLVTTLKERERKLEIKLLEYYGLKEQETAVMELQNRLKSNSMEAKVLALKIESLQSDNRRLEAQMADYSEVVSDLEAARARIKLLKKKLRSESAQNKERILELQKRVQKMQEDEHKGVVEIDSDVQMQLQKLKDLEAKADELRESNYSLQLEKSELAQRLEQVQGLATPVLEDKEKEKLKEEIQHLKKQNEDLTKEIEQLQADRCTDVEELVYLRWINACLRYELRNFKPEPHKTMARDLSKTLSPKSEQKAKQLIIEYANKEGTAEKGINFQELDSDQWSSSQASNSGDLDESLNKSNNKFLGKLMKVLRGKDSHSHSRDPSIEYRNDLNSIDSEISMGFYKSIDSIAEGGCSNSCSSSDLEKYAEVLKDSQAKLKPKIRGRSAPFRSF